MLSLYRALLRLRRAEQTLSLGSFALIERTAYTLIYERRRGENGILVVLNMSDRPQAVRVKVARCELLLTTYMDATGDILDREITLRPDEGLILRQPPKPI